MEEMQAYSHPRGGFVVSYRNWSYGIFMADTPADQYGEFFDQLPQELITIASNESHPAASAGFRNLSEGDLKNLKDMFVDAAEAFGKDLEFRVLGD